MLTIISYLVYTEILHVANVVTDVLHYARTKVICCLSVVVTKIARSRVLGICACCNYHELVDIGEKLVSVRFKLLNTAH